MDEIKDSINVLAKELRKALYNVGKNFFYDRTSGGIIVREYESGYIVAVEGKKIHIKSSKVGLKSGDNVKICFPQNKDQDAFIVVDTEFVKKIMG